MYAVIRQKVHAIIRQKIVYAVIRQKIVRYSHYGLGIGLPIVLSAALLLLSTLLPGSRSSPPVPTQDGRPPTEAARVIGWDEFAASRPDALRALAEPIMECVQSSETPHPVFNRCLTWHNHVHGVLALLATSRITGNSVYRDTVMQAVGDESRLALEAEQIRSGALDNDENPYGFAWLLYLDVEADRQGITVFHDTAAAAQDRMRGWLDTLSPDQLNAAARSNQFSNASWALSALAWWGRYFDDAAARDSAGRFGQLVLGGENLASICSRGLLAEQDQFFSPCHQTVLLAIMIGKQDGLEPALTVMRQTKPLNAESMLTLNSAGLNFSSSWGALAAWFVTGDPEYRDVFAGMVSAHLQMPERWRDSYTGTWVPQFGSFAIALTYDLVG